MDREKHVMGLSIIIPTFNRAELLDIGLSSIVRQGISFDYEIIIENDGGEELETLDVIKKHSLPIRYYYIQKQEGLWTCPSVPINRGISRAKFDIVCLTCPEIFHIGRTFERMHKQCKDGVIVISNGKDDSSGNFLLFVKATNGAYDRNELNRCKYLATELPFCMMMTKKDFLSVGGYDEIYNDGIGYEDSDFVNKLRKKQFKFLKVDETIVHLFHDRKKRYANGHHKRWQRNHDIFTERWGKEWKFK